MAIDIKREAFDKTVKNAIALTYPNLPLGNSKRAKKLRNYEIVEKLTIFLAFSLALCYNNSIKKRADGCGMSEQKTIQSEQLSAQIIIALLSENAVLKEELALAQEQLAWLKKQIFERKTEQSSVIMDGGTQLPLFSGMQTPAAFKLEETVNVPEHKRKKKRTHDDWMSTLPVEEIEHKEEHTVCENCGTEMQEIGKEKAYDELVYTPAKYRIRRHIVYTYKCSDCGENPENDANHTDDIEHCNTANGASWSATLYSVVATAQANGMDVEQYLTELFSQPIGTIILPWKE